ncbi:uncharacterized protein K452DRAFT_318062 [Aplosporella prunicola CBS 121167]|uniref:RRM domain-containing protein n=1 Tax=Aplosporella prunicola CBS 121167 TaxID=1176127 RepID=A0A6A6BE17_9PEZI|nr:uncharacterized protein K452DRAFT_318062 [Aplosporella prunicola CBS 121167]KAF2142419.1 hypothetical protein K452DRAFT_318062 [Aplosporella prunicola CBS 121167]
MAPETKNKKRKSGVTASSPSTKKLKKAEAPVAEEAPAPVKSTKKSKAAAPKAEAEPAVSAAAKSKSSRKRASDFFPTEEEETPAVETKSKKAKKAADAEEATPVKATKEKKSKKAKVEKEPTPVEEDEEELVAEEAEDNSDDDDDDEDDQTAALLKGFESDEDENEGEEEEGGVEMDKIPTLPNEKKLRKKLNKASGEDKSGPGVVYVGRIPHGFYEHQMRAYFSQFGNITRLRLSRNKKTGRSKHYAFVEFEHASVADIVAETMDKYLMFGHILQVRQIPAEQVHEKLFKGANKRFKPAPRNKMEGRRLRLALDRDGWDKRVTRESERRKKKEEKLRELGYEFEAPALKSASTVPTKDKALPAPAEEEKPKAIKQKAHKETSDEVTDVVVQKEPDAVTVTEKTTKKPKRKSNGAVETEKEVKVTKAKKETAKPAAKAAAKPAAKKAKKAKA